MLNFKAQSYTDGIAFSNNYITLKATFSNNLIKVYKINSTIDSDFENKFFRLYIITIILSTIFSYIYTRNFIIAFIILLNNIYFNISLSGLIYYIILSLKKNDFKKFHGAEHMVVNSFVKTGKIPKIEEVVKYSRISPLCGSVKISFKSTLGIMNYIILLKSYKNGFIITILLLVISLLICILLYILNFFRLTQFLITAKPDEKHLKLAIAVLKSFVKNNKESP